MNSITVGRFAELCQGVLYNSDPNKLVIGFALYDRDVVPGQVFIAISGARTDGHAFAENAMSAGAVAVLSEKALDCPHVLVPSVVEALANFGSALRDSFRGPVIGITGSNGKTTTKEMTVAALSPLGDVLKSPSNKNTEYSSPLVWFQANHQSAAVIEMAMRGFGQIRHLALIARPDVGVVTNIGTAHAEKVGNREGIMRAKAELIVELPASGCTILWSEDDFLAELRKCSAAPVRTFGFSQEAECRVLGYRALDWGKCAVRLSLDGKTAECELPVIGRHQALNAAAAVLAAHSVGVSVKDSVDNLYKSELPAMRLQVLELDGAIVLLDTYNASPDSTVAALRVLSEGPCKGRRIAVLGEMRELGDFTESGHRLVGKELVGSTIDKVFLTGGPTDFIASEATMAGYPSQNIVQDKELDIGHVEEFLSGLKEGDVVLVKGSRALGLERALPARAK